MRFPFSAAEKTAEDGEQPPAADAQTVLPVQPVNRL